MGLLSDPEAGPSKWAHFLIKFHRPFCFLLCVVGYVWFGLLAHRSFNNQNNFSENALLPGLVRSEFVDDGTAKRFLNELQEEVRENYATKDSMPVPWLAAKMRQLHLDVYTHNFTLNFPLGKGQRFQGENVYGILRAGRSASTEALVLSAPFRPLSSHHKSTDAGIALMLAMAKFARSRKYWAKDLIFLVTEHEQLGAQAWLQAYHDTGSTSSSWLNAGSLKGRAGAIQAAINLELSSLSMKYIEVKVEGLNGQLPNLDLVTLVHKMCMQSSVHHAYKNSYSWVPRQGPWKNWSNSLNTLLSMVTTQVTGVPTGNHGLFHRYGIEAVTLMSAGEGAGAGRPAHALEASLRSLNNLLERFHQSYFFYLRTSTDRFLSISQYMPPLGLLSAALFIRAFALWLTSQKQDNGKESKTGGKDTEISKDSATQAKDKPKTDEGSGDKDDKSVKKEKKDDATIKTIIDDDNTEMTQETNKSKKDGEKKDTPNHLNLLNVLITFLVIHSIGYAVKISPQLISEIGVKHFALPTEQAIFYGLCVISGFLVLFLPFVLDQLLNNGDSTTVNEGTRRPLMILALLELATLVLCVGMHNFSLGFCMAAVYAPMVLMIGTGGNGKRSRFVSFLSKTQWLVLHPLTLTLLVVLAYTGFTFPEEPPAELFNRGLVATHQAIMFSIVDGMIYGNWLFNIVTSILLPVWMLFWQILNY